ncbi:MAG: hypothetical protein CMK83_01490 [Pseudomonadales bacterium]|jgi:hypothetical protein|uniref:DUF2760 domain-containing protein n=1 Tax=unclassified Ketobacter TaxID=2639109 RepID=UPI000C6807E2|nr:MULTISPECIES: DUF2760 domain-containing protein [unclassified Ketobacter]MAQ22868.1 hypothetical protein [Pseudomonadales bacterium]MEC8810813.1 DUF2760 domain-containing protein [Pseudomonadota bacterium]TNC89550.1 MAG: hypothetical protein CSH49_06825 [Alcanivorax sp.]HAG93712.1 DUF2760 domain-containing protein [Gammaproteobacteria bacterium]MBI26576.1 hypothetical protein [Pseudomonadales bacterium]
MDINPVMPTTIDALHLILGGLGFILLVVAVLRGGGKKAPAPDSATEPEPVAPAATPTPTPALKSNDPESALQLLGLLQQEARFVDFLQEDLTGFSDAEIGAVSRVLHEGSKKVLDQYFSLVPVRSEEEETQVTLAAGFDPAQNRVTGNVVGEPPFSGVLVHRGWKAVKADLPRLAPGHDPKVIAPAEVEL